MNVREHLAAVHTLAGEHHVAVAKHHQALAGHYAKLAECSKAELEDSSAAKHYQAIADDHAAQGEEHATQADYHTKCAKDLSGSSGKAAGDGDLRKSALDDVSAIVPDADVRMVPRYGQREIGRDEAPLSPGLEKVFGANEV